MRRPLLRTTILCLVLLECAAMARAGEPGQVHAIVQIVSQKYCYADNEMYTVSLTLNIRITNSSRKSYYIMSDIVPLVGRVADSIESAHAGNYLNKWEAHLALGADRDYRAKRIWIKPAHSVVLHSAYGVPARYKTAPSIPGTVSPGSYALELVLHPKVDPGGTGEDRKPRIDSFTTEPVMFEVPDQVTPRPCD